MYFNYLVRCDNLLSIFIFSLDIFNLFLVRDLYWLKHSPNTSWDITFLQNVLSYSVLSSEALFPLYNETHRFFLFQSLVFSASLQSWIFISALFWSIEMFLISLSRGLLDYWLGGLIILSLTYMFIDCFIYSHCLATICDNFVQVIRLNYSW